MTLNFDRLEQARVKGDPFPYLVMNDAIDPALAKEVAAAFPSIDRPGAVRVDDTKPGFAFNALLDDLRSDRFRSIIASKFDIDLDDKEVVINVRGLSRWTDGNIHTDTPSKLITVLLYFNEPDAMTATTGLRILKNDRDIDDYDAEIPPVLGNLIAFKVTPDCWHGFKPYQGKRQSLQLNFLSGIQTARKHEAGRRFVRHATRRVTSASVAARTAARKVERDASALWLAAFDTRTPWYVKLVAGVSTFFAISPIDLSPDFLPVVGVLDDLAILAIGTFVTARLIPKPLMSDLRRRADTIEFTHARLGLAGIICIWFIASAIALMRAIGVA